MIVSHGHAPGSATAQRDATFTGAVWADSILSGGGAPTVNTVVFPPGARTHWHTHERGQLLVVTHGRGFAAVRDADVTELGAGDVVWFAPDEVHWHGAGPDTLLTHVAISLGTTSWLDEVSEAQYGAVTDSTSR